MLPNKCETLNAMPGRLVLTYAIAWMAPMGIMWFLAPALQRYLAGRGVDVGDAWTFEWWLGLVPYPVPFTARAGLGLALVIAPPIVFVFLWWRTRRRARAVSIG